ncbi:LysR family transcriptional regulator [Streptomyces spectabilis]|uniref:LysR family transcriptional regulator n=1 Tax=Streptomyces spectabilis TaxID=68270 RepID=A0A516R8W1_STRST|nr:LysR family transcriptional regulator [Streptomyces spectabilis]QDQ12091.1 LysR family transcriptional regulator [Streptomyces spectabilis]
MNWTSAQLRSLVELGRRGTVTAVAAALGYTPGGVSQQLAALERATGHGLLRRTGRRVELTEAGRTLARHAERILATEADALAALERTRTEVTGVLRVALFATAAAELLPQALRGAREAHPGLEIHTREMPDVDAVFDAVTSSAVDLALGLDYPDVPIPRDPALRLIPLHTERFALAAPRGLLTGPATLPGGYAEGRVPLPLRSTQALPWILPSPHSYYGRAIRTACRRAGVEPRVQHEVTDTAATLALVEAGIGVTPVTPLMLRLRPSQVDVVPLADAPLRRIVAIHRTTADPLPALTALIAILRTPPQPQGTPGPPSDTLSKAALTDGTPS